MMLNGMALEGAEWVAAERPSGLPPAARDYLAHTEEGRTLRELAREARVAPSTVMRRVRRMEGSRDDPLVDSALRQLSAAEARGADEAALLDEALPVLRRLAEPGAVLAVARDMDRGVVVRDAADGEPQRLAVVERPLAEAMALRDWISCAAPEARIHRYRITNQGRAVARRGLSEPARGMAEAAAAFEGARVVEPAEDLRLRHMRSVLAESPLLGLSRRRNGEGKPFLGRDLVAAGEKMREDFELAERDAAGAPDWEGLLAGHGGAPPEPGGAAARVLEALDDLGPGLADVCFRCCCLLEGLETLERRMGWSARSGKVVLRIALERLRAHYALVDGRAQA